MTNIQGKTRAAEDSCFAADDVVAYKVLQVQGGMCQAMITSLTCPASCTPIALAYLMMTLEHDTTVSSTPILSTATGSSLCPSDRLTKGTAPAAGAVSSVLPSLLSTAAGVRLHGADAADGNMHKSDSSIASESFDCSASESDGRGSTPYIGGCRAAAACAAREVVPVAERCRLKWFARDEGDWGAVAVAVRGGWLEGKLPEFASDGSCGEESSSVGHCSGSCMAGGPVAMQSFSGACSASGNMCTMMQLYLL